MTLALELKVADGVVAEVGHPVVRWMRAAPSDGIPIFCGIFGGIEQ
jgi:hypothetical protein